MSSTSRTGEWRNPAEAERGRSETGKYFQCFIGCIDTFSEIQRQLPCSNPCGQVPPTLKLLANL